MSKTLIELQLERGRLLERIAAQRQQLAVQAEPLAATLRWGDRLQNSLRSGTAFAQRHPLAVGLLAAALLVLKPGASLRWAGRGLSLWRSWRNLQALLPDALRQGLLERLGKLL